MKITIAELNLAYDKVNEIKKSLSKQKDIIEIDIERNPLTDENFFNEDSEFVMPFKLTFKFDKDLGSKGSYVLATKNIEIIEEVD